MPDTATPASDVTLSASAARRIAKIVAGQPAGTMLRVEVIGGGCSGFSYRFGFAERDGAKAVVDEASLPFLAGSEIDFVDEIIGASFRVHNPNATSGCGCGTSFSV
jgi:iron-sulfur cluster assembly accessory protein